MPVAHLNGTTLYYEMQGKGMPILFVHGHGLTHTMFKPQMDYFSEKYKVIVCDLRGNGKSGKLSQATRDIMKTQCADLIMLLNGLHLRDAVFVGLSYGGLLVQQIALEYPERIRAMVVADSYGGEENSAMMRALQSAAAYCSWLTYYAPSAWILPAIRLSYQPWNKAYRIIRRSMAEKRPGELYKQRMAMNGWSSSGQLHRVTLPSLCLAGDRGEYTAHRMKEMAARLPDAHFALIPDSVSPCNLCQPEIFNLLLERFLEANLSIESGRRRVSIGTVQTKDA
ncbi:alpha/beta fold hydrolase [Fontibacillus sp. BL9]|uniref:alpha/beta fold hydrolase n=1 Tax=Fontibacillus sp. BL9 TaxID=3389971 RepID=UPI00397D6859